MAPSPLPPDDPSGENPLDLERRGWLSLSADAHTARAWYDQILDDVVLMILPGGLRIETREDALEAMGGPPWSEHRLSAERLLVLDEGAAIVTYQADARRGVDDYRALCASTYVRRAGGWRLAVHQQTPW